MKFTLVALILSMAAIVSCQSTAKPEYKKFANDGEVPRIVLDDAKKDYDAGTTVIVDSRPAGAYGQEHIKGAVNIPIGSPDSEFDKLPKGKKIIVYCS